MVYEYHPTGICAKTITVDVENGILKGVNFQGGCDGNHKGLIALSVGNNLEELSKKLKGITCGLRSTSCPDQLVKAMEEAISHSSL